MVGGGGGMGPGRVLSGRVRPSPEDDAALLRLLACVAAYLVAGLVTFVVLAALHWPEASGWARVARLGLHALQAAAWPVTWAVNLCLCCLD